MYKIYYYLFINYFILIVLIKVDTNFCNQYLKKDKAVNINYSIFRPKKSKQTYLHN